MTDRLTVIIHVMVYSKVFNYTDGCSLFFVINSHFCKIHISVETR